MQGNCEEGTEARRIQGKKYAHIERRKQNERPKGVAEYESQSEPTGPQFGGVLIKDHLISQVAVQLRKAILRITISKITKVVDQKARNQLVE